MKKQLKLATLVATVVLASVSAWSIPISTDQYGIGTIDPGSPADPSDEAGYVNISLQVWNETLSPGTYGGHTYAKLAGTSVPTPLPYPWSGTPVKTDVSGGGLSATIDLGAGGYLYLLGKFGDADILWYVGGMTGEVTITNDKLRPNGLSHYTLFPGAPDVPDTASTFMLLGMGISGILWFARSKNK